ncbi:hypothetical protein KZ770_25560 [Escherichia coli]|nr:hypothetical protein [Escherichia coli]
MGGDGWSPSVLKEQYGMARSGTEEGAIFDVLLDGDQYVAPDEYVFFCTRIMLIVKYQISLF